MGITNAQAATLNKSMRAAQNVSLGTIVQTLQGQAVTAGSMLITAAHANASSVVITTGVASPTVAIVEIYRSGSMLMTGGAYGPYVVKSSGSLTVAASGSYTVVANDWINYIVF